jgi:hypothetical protein
LPCAAKLVEALAQLVLDGLDGASASRSRGVT